MSETSDAHTHSNEKLHASSDVDRHHFDEHDLDQVQRRLGERHVQMIAIAGAVGTGLFLASGAVLATAGPLGALLAFILVGSVSYATLCSLGEMTTWAPVSGTFHHFAARWVDPAWGFALGWNYFYLTGVGLPAEITAAVIVLGFWDQNHQAVYTLVMCIAVVTINLIGVRYFAETEVFFAVMKILLIIGLLIGGLVIDLGGGPDHDRIGFRFWNDPGAWNRAGLVKNIHTDRFLAFLSVLLLAAFTFQGMELVCIAASETKNPRRNIKTAVNRVFYRICVFYILSILMVGMLVAYDDKALLHSTGNAAQSPFVIAMTRAGVRGVPHIVNACIFASALSACNSLLFAGSRILYGLALRGQAPRFLAYCTKSGLPLAAILTTACFSLLSFMNVRSGSETVFHWLLNIVTTGGFITWFSINLTFVFFRRGLIAQGYDRRKNSYYNRWQPFVAYWGIFWNLFFILINGYAVFYNFKGADFVAAYITLPIFALLYVGWKITKRTKFWKPEDMDFVTGIPAQDETENEESELTLVQKIRDKIF